MIKNSTKGTVTDFDGLFEIVAQKGDIFVVSYIGMKKQEVVVENQNVNIQLQSDYSQLDEVVVSVGYFDVSKKDLS